MTRTAHYGWAGLNYQTFSSIKSPASRPGHLFPGCLPVIVSERKKPPKGGFSIFVSG